jgi:hypothetical protein
MNKLAEFHKAIEELGVTPGSIYNADQTGLYFTKLPNQIYVDKANRENVAGCKKANEVKRSHHSHGLHCCNWCKDATDHWWQGKAAGCFQVRTAYRTRPPIPYTSQSKAWFDRKVTVWWINNVFWPHHLREHGDVWAILLLDNCSSHRVGRITFAEDAQDYLFSSKFDKSAPTS